MIFLIFYLDRELNPAPLIKTNERKFYSSHDISQTDIAYANINQSIYAIITRRLIMLQSVKCVHNYVIKRKMCSR